MLKLIEYTDPACPWAFSAEPARRRIDWLYGEQIQWTLCMVGLSESSAQFEGTKYTPEWQVGSMRRFARDFGMPIDTRLRERMAASLPACRAVVAAGMIQPAREQALLRALRVRNFSGDLLDDPQTISAAAADAGLDPQRLADQMADARTEQLLRADMACAREPSRAASALDHKLGNWPGGRRYTCPSYELIREADGMKMSAPGFQPVAAYEVLIANLVPEIERRADPQSVAEVLEWAGEPLATVEVAAVCEGDLAEVREQLSRVARLRPVGNDGYWSAPAS